MKQFLFFLLSVFAVSTFAATPVGNNKRLNALYDLPLIGLSNFSGTGVADESAKLQALFNKFNNVDASSMRDSGYTIFWPPTANLVKVNSEVFAEGKVKIEGAHFFYTDSATMGETTPMILFIGKGNINWLNVVASGTHTKLIGALVQINANPNHCDSITLDHCDIGNAACQNGLRFGDMSSDSDWDYWIDHILITHCSFKHIWTAGYQVNTEDLIGGSLKYANHGIHLGQTCLRLKIEYCEGEDISSDWCFGAGSTRGMKAHRKMGKYYGNWEFCHNTVTKCGMCIELNGNSYGEGVNIHDNDLKYSTRNGGFLISCNLSKRLRIVNNDLINDDRGLIEFCSIDGIVKGNTGRIECYSDTTQGYPPTALPLGSNRIHFIEGYGYNNIIADNNFEADRSNPYTFSPAEFDGIAVCGKTTSPTYQDTTYRGITDYSAYWDIKNNTLTGNTNRVLDVTVAQIRNINFIGNTVNTNVMLESPVQIWGPNWNVSNNTFILDGCYPTNGNSCIRLNSQQTTSPNAIVANNIIWNSAWKGKWWYSGASATNVFKDSK